MDWWVGGDAAERYHSCAPYSCLLLTGELSVLTE
jgi:hypothetical protein